ncbi:MAG TPA: hypothetical protein VIQ51_09065 [Chryseosolibacter sp.]
MKGICFTLIMILSGLAASGQHAKNTLSLTVSGKDRISVVKSSVHLAEWHEKSFWPVYERYLSDASKIYSLTYRSLEDLAETDAAVADEEAFDNGWKLLVYRNDELKLRKKYYQEVGAILNGVVALQFLQTEAMMDMLESSNIYSKTEWEKYRFHAQTLPPDKVREAKHNTLKNALKLPDEKENIFWSVYSKYEDETDALLGEAYSVYSLFASDAADFTPALAKRLGNDLLHIMEREVRLKERFFLEMNSMVGSNIAARCLAWEDYYSLVSKMHAWVDTP